MSKLDSLVENGQKERLRYGTYLLLIPVPVEFDFAALSVPMVMVRLTMHLDSVHTQGLEKFETFVAEGAPERFVFATVSVYQRIIQYNFKFFREHRF